MIKPNPDIPEAISSLSEWHRWFAWYPVVISIQGIRIRVWLRHIQRKLGTSRLTGEGNGAIGRPALSQSCADSAKKAGTNDRPSEKTEFARRRPRRLARPGVFLR